MAAANFLWLPLQRQVNVTGRVERISKAESLEYFHSVLLVARLAWYHPKARLYQGVVSLILDSKSIDKNLQVLRCRYQRTGVAIV